MPLHDKPFAPACERNRDPILAVLQRFLADCRTVLEIGSGTGQHAVHFGTAMPHLVWQTSDVADNHPGIRAWLDEAGLTNVRKPLALDVTGDWPAGDFDVVFAANTLHIMDWAAVREFFAGVGRVLASGGWLIVYGPFHYHGRATGAGNARFDASLRAQSGGMGIRDVADVDPLAAGVGLRLVADVAMPADNRCLVWCRDGGVG